MKLASIYLAHLPSVLEAERVGGCFFGLTFRFVGFDVESVLSAFFKWCNARFPRRIAGIPEFYFRNSA